MKNKTISIVSLLSILTVSTFALDIKSNSEAINIAGKQRMFTQRIIKDYAMVGMKNTFGSPEKDLQKIVISFSEGLESIDNFNKDKKIEEKIKETAGFWANIKIRLEKEPSKEEALLLRKDLNKLFTLSNEIVTLLSGETTNKNIVNKSGKQRMLSQRMAALYMFKVWNIEGDKTFEADLQKTLKEFKVSHDELLKSDKNTAEINKKLKKVSRAYRFFEMMSRSKSKYVPSLIYKKSNDILKQMNEVTNLYVKSEGGK